MRNLRLPGGHPYAPNHTDATTVTPIRCNGQSTRDAIEKFRDTMSEAGIVPPEVIEADGLLHRFHVEGDRRGSQNGWYLLHLDGRAAGAFGSWRSGIRSTWCDSGQYKSTNDHLVVDVQIAAARARAQSKRRAEYEMRAIWARREWTTAGPADPSHPYLRAKYVKPLDLRQAGNALLVPLFDAYGFMWNVQRIHADGEKRFRPGRAGGLFSPIGDLTKPTTLLVCEGWATGATLHDETGFPILCAMNAGNLLAVAKDARASWPGADLVICADNDRNTAGNPGLKAATAAADAAGARLIVPEFADGADGTDFNDLATIGRGRVAA